MLEKMKNMKLYQKIVAVLFGCSVLGAGFYNIQSTDNYDASINYTTNDSASTTVQTVYLPAVTSTMQIISDIVANASTSTAGASWHCVDTFKRSSSTVDIVEQIGSEVCDINRMSTTWNYGLTTTTNGGVSANIQGATSNTINWVIKLDTLIAQ